MQREIVITGDGSSSILLPEVNEHYHSKHGAIKESQYVFIDNGLKICDKNSIKILEIGFGTGLNALLTLSFANEKRTTIEYTSLEPFPLTEDEYNALNYAKELNMANDDFIALHKAKWNENSTISPFFSLTKQNIMVEDFSATNQYDLIYFDAFGSRVQPEMWTDEIIHQMYDALTINGIFVTYSAKGSVRRAMKNAGFKVEKLPGPPPKREMLRGMKI